jgi:hypothetical protein
MSPREASPPHKLLPFVLVVNKHKNEDFITCFWIFTRTAVNKTYYFNYIYLLTADAMKQNSFIIMAVLVHTSLYFHVYQWLADGVSIGDWI